MPTIWGLLGLLLILVCIGLICAARITLFSHMFLLVKLEL